MQASAGFADWDFNFAQIVDDKELDANVVKVVMTPADGLNPLPAEESRVAGGK